jgi:hypothetical protein
MHYKKALIVIFVMSCGLLRAEKETAHQQAIVHHGVSDSHEADIAAHHLESDPVVDEILALIEHKAIQTPAVTPPSPFMKWLRSVGISLMYKYHAVKTWITADS